jgi:hypothetical protein
MYQMTRQERQRDILLMDSYRERKKMVNIHNSLREQITTRHTVRASFGRCEIRTLIILRAYYFEFLFTNPYDRDQNFEIAWDDAELRQVILSNPIESSLILANGNISEEYMKYESVSRTSSSAFYQTEQRRYF